MILKTLQRFWTRGFFVTSQKRRILETGCSPPKLAETSCRGCMSSPPSDSAHYPPSIVSASPSRSWKMDPDSSLRFASAFFSFGLLNNTPYVLILSAALSILPADTPKGVLLFANIAPALAVKLFWPYFVRGNIQYARRVFACSLLSFGGMLCVALNEGLYPRLAGIAIASFSSGLGEMTFLQLATLYGEATNGTDKAISWFASGTGGAGLFGAGLWWTLRGLGVTKGLGLCSVRIANQLPHEVNSDPLFSDFTAVPRRHVFAPSLAVEDVSIRRLRCSARV